MKYNYFFFTILFAVLFTSVAFAQKAKVFRDHCYSGASQSLYGNSYNQSQLTVGNDKISSIVVYPGWEVVVFEHKNFKGKCYSLVSDMNDLKSIDFGDKISSIKIYPKTYPSNYPSDKVLPNHFLNATSVKEIGTSSPIINKLLHPLLQSVSKIHSQGLGWDDITGNYVYTGCKSSPSFFNIKQKGCTGESYIILFDPNLNHALDVKVSSKYDGLKGGVSHPSDIQITNGVFPVAIEKEGEIGCFIEFYEVGPNSLKYLSSSDMHTATDHLGAIAYANINGNTYMIGAVTGGKKLHIWKSNGINKHTGFSYVKTIHPFNITGCGVDDNWSTKYQSHWLGKMENGKIVLAASHGDNGFKGGKGWIDLWEINSLEAGVPVTITKIHKKRTKRFPKKSHFYEGMTFGPNNHIITAPNDFVVKYPNFFHLKSNMFKLHYKYKSCTYNKYSVQSQAAPTPEADEKDQVHNITETETALHKDQPALQHTKIKYSPNPFSDRVIVDFSTFKNETTDGFLSITNLTGKIVRKIRLSNLVFQDEHLSLDLSDLEDGVYFFTVQTQQYFSTQKLIKLKK